MASRMFFQRPENALSKAEEFINVGKPTRALEILYEVIKARKRFHNVPEKLIEQIMYKYLDLCVELKKSQIAKEGLYQYKNMCQVTNVASLAAVVQSYLSLAEKRTEQAKQESHESVADIDDLEVVSTPEMLMLSAVSGEGAQDRSDRKILIPWVKFLWESYCQCLEMLKTNARVERLYHDIAQQAFAFCLKYQRKTEFRKLCDKLRNHHEMVLKQQPNLQVALANDTPTNIINLNNAENQQRNLDTRHVQLDSAIQMEIWQEAYKAVDDIQGLMVATKKVIQPKMMASYYQKLALIFWMSGNQLFHAATLVKHYHLTRGSRKNISGEELNRMASRVTMACLAIPVPSRHPEIDLFVGSEYKPLEKSIRLSALLNLSTPPSRQSLLKEIHKFGVVSAASPSVQELYSMLEVNFQPLKLCSSVDGVLCSFNKSDDMIHLRQYSDSVREVSIFRLLKQVTEVYETISYDRLLKLTANFVDTLELEQTIMDYVRSNDLPIRVDHKTSQLHFGSNCMTIKSSCKDDFDGASDGPHLQDMPSEQIKTQLINLYDVLDASVNLIHPMMEKIKNNNLRLKLVESYNSSKTRDHQRLLARHKRIEKRKEYIERLTWDREEEENARQEQQLKEIQKMEDDRLLVERKERQKRIEAEAIRQIEKNNLAGKLEQMKTTKIGKKIFDNMNEEEIAALDNNQIKAKQREEFEKEKRELVARKKAQEKKVDYFERAKRKEEIPLLINAYEIAKDADKKLWKSMEEERIKLIIMERENDLKQRERFERMSEERKIYLNEIFDGRRTLFEAKMAEFETRMDEERTKRLEARRVGRVEERKRKRLQDIAKLKQKRRDEISQRKREEEERRLQEERAKAEMTRRENERKQEEQLKIQRAKEQEVEDRLRRERVEREKKTYNDSQTAGGRDDSSRGSWRPRDRDRDDNRNATSSRITTSSRGNTDDWRNADNRKDREWGGGGGGFNSQNRRNEGSSSFGGSGGRNEGSSSFGGSGGRNEGSSSFGGGSGVGGRGSGRYQQQGRDNRGGGGGGDMRRTRPSDEGSWLNRGGDSNKSTNQQRDSNRRP